MKSKRSKQNHVLIEVIGWFGVICILGAYVLLSIGAVDATSLIYHVLNLVGAAGIVIDAYVAKDYQPVALNFVWGLIALYAIFRIVIILV